MRRRQFDRVAVHSGHGRGRRKREKEILHPRQDLSPQARCVTVLDALRRLDPALTGEQVRTVVSAPLIRVCCVVRSTSRLRRVGRVQRIRPGRIHGIRNTRSRYADGVAPNGDWPKEGQAHDHAEQGEPLEGQCRRENGG